MALPSPIASPTSTPTASSSSAPPPLGSLAESPWPVMPSSLAATASAKATTGVTMPSLSPLSTLSNRRSRMGTRRSLITCALSAASVGANVAPTKPANAQDRSPKIHAAAKDPSSTESGSPIPSNRAGRKASCLSLETFTLAASANNRRASVTSARRWTEGVSTSTGSGPQSGFPSRKPATRKKSGPLMFIRPSRSETTAHPRTRRARTANVSSVTPFARRGRQS